MLVLLFCSSIILCRMQIECLKLCQWNLTCQNDMFRLCILLSKNYCFGLWMRESGWESNPERANSLPLTNYSMRMQKNEVCLRANSTACVCYDIFKITESKPWESPRCYAKHHIEEIESFYQWSQRWLLFFRWSESGFIAVNLENDCDAVEVSW